MMMTRRSLNINHKISAGAGFTLLELMVAVAIIVLLTVLSIPRFSALKDNLDASAARNTLSAALAQARNLAIRGDLGDIAVVFFYDRDNERYTMLTARLRAKGLPNPNDLGSPYDVFLPVPGAKVLSLPRGWEVRGLGYAARNASKWFNHTADASDPDTWWVFPESDRHFTDRQTFMVRYSAGEGTVVTSNEQFNSPDAWLYTNPRVPFENRDLSDPASVNAVFNDGVHLRAAPALTLYDVQTLAASVQGAVVQRDTGTLYGLDYGTNGSAQDGSYLQALTYVDANSDSHTGYEALFWYLDENVDPVVFGRFTGMVLRNDLR